MVNVAWYLCKWLHNYQATLIIIVFRHLTGQYSIPCLQNLFNGCHLEIYEFRESRNLLRDLSTILWFTFSYFFIYHGHYVHQVCIMPMRVYMLG